tara:strand:+ start:156 stop:509 length:354 start_codon:yes stop_codon:yes gene_type:complete
MNQEVPNTISVQRLEAWISQEVEKPLLVDVREDQELVIAPFSYPVVHLPLSELANWSSDLDNLIPIDRSVVVICHAGIRSRNFAIWLLQQDSNYRIWNLEGGIDAWSALIDPEITRY